MTDSGWRKRQIALDIKAKNARELGLDYEPDKTIMQMAREAGFITLSINQDTWGPYLERFAELVRADERNSWPLEMEAMERQVNILTDALAQRTWVGLTKEAISEFDTWLDDREEEKGWVPPSEIVAYIEAKSKELNHG